MGNIIGMLAGELMSGSSVKQVAKAAGVNEKQAENLMGNAIPLLVQAMSDNAGTKVGAESLYEALGQHVGGIVIAAAKQAGKHAALVYAVGIGVIVEQRSVEATAAGLYSLTAHAAPEQ